MKNPAKKLLIALLSLVSAWSLSAQTTITGVVTDEGGEPLMGVGKFETCDEITRKSKPKPETSRGSVYFLII